METSARRPTVELKLARLADAQQIASMSRDLIEDGLRWSWTPARVAACIRTADCNVLTSWADGGLVGFAVMQFFDEHAHLNLLAVGPAYRRAGIGRRLIEWLEETARVGGMFLIQLEVRAGNAGARTFYRRLGYREAKSIPGYYGGREAAIRMTHDLGCRSSASITEHTP
ncbi:MAG: GNAT family N-acetyltransferase [Candidatus Binatia bacterium]